MNSTLILIGGGGHCKSCIDVIEMEGKYHIAGIVDVSKKLQKRILGYTIMGTDQDLPKLVEDFVAAHEVYHLTDRSKWWLWREIKANLCVGWRHWRGFILCVAMSLTVERLKFYADRFKRRE